MIERHVERGVPLADADANDVVRIVAGKMVVREANNVPRSVRQCSSGDAHPALSVIVADVLVAAVRNDCLLLKR